MSKLIVIDGLDGSGKGTQTRMLRAYLKEKGIENELISFPMYECESSSLVKLYLSGELGQRPEDNNAYAASMLFAADRYVSYKKVWKTLYDKEGAVLIADRYTSANAVHQLTKLPETEWDAFLEWLYDFEHVKLGLPLPDHTVYIEMPPSICRKLIAKRARETGRTVDIHEKDAGHLDRAYRSAIYAAGKLHWDRVVAYRGDEPRSREEIFRDLLKATGLSDL